MKLHSAKADASLARLLTTTSDICGLLSYSFSYLEDAQFKFI
jgi:hypothetical protein